MNKNSLDFLKKQMRGNYIFLLSALIFITAGSFFSFLGPKLIGVAVDSVIGSAPFDLPVWVTSRIERLGGREFFLSRIYIVILLFTGIKAAEAVCEYGRMRSSNFLSERLGYNMRQGVFERLQSATYLYHKGVYTGDIIQRCSTDIDTVRNFVIEMTDIIRVVAKIAVAYWFMAGISLPLALVSFVTVPLVSGFSVFFYSKIQKRFLRADEAEGRLQAMAQENLSAPRVVRAFGRQRAERDNFCRRNSRFSDMWIKVGDLLAWYWSTGDLLTVLQVVLVLCAGTYFAVLGLITSGQVISFMIYNNMLAWPIRSLGRIVGNMSKATVALGRISEVYNAPQEDYEKGVDMTFKGDIAFKDVSFSYGGNKVLDGASFEIDRGQTAAILGASGSGKSTILALLAGFITPDSGQITIDGVDISEINLHSLRRGVGIVMQEPFLFSRSILENIAITDPRPDIERAKKSAEIARVGRTIEGFEKGYDTRVGERGVTLSGGQKQRIAIARTLYAGAKILCFDDSLSAVDSITDRNIRRNLAENIKGLTTIIISQRVNTLMEADKILVLDGGKVVQEGTHRRLCAQPGIYREIVKIQTDIALMAREEAK